VGAQTPPKTSLTHLSRHTRNEKRTAEAVLSSNGFDFESQPAPGVGGDPIDQPERLIHQYLAHRREREHQVIAALAGGLRSVDALVSRIYVGLAAALVPMAQESVLAHLQKLEHDQVVRRDGEEWALY
jgi:hypothetical protein